MKGQIVLVEPQCRGFAHAMFNAAIIECFITSYPDADIIFMAEPVHLQVVQEAFASYSIHQKKAPHWVKMEIPKRLKLSGIPWIYT